MLTLPSCRHLYRFAGMVEHVFNASLVIMNLCFGEDFVAEVLAEESEGIQIDLSTQDFTKFMFQSEKAESHARLL